MYMDRKQTYQADGEQRRMKSIARNAHAIIIDRPAAGGDRLEGFSNGVSFGLPRCDNVDVCILLYIPTHTCMRM